MHSEDSHLTSRVRRRLSWRPLAALLAVAAIIAGRSASFSTCHCWRTLGASTDTNAVHNTLGPGLVRTDDDMLTVTDPTKAYLELAADGTSAYLRIDSPSHDTIDAVHEQAEAESRANGDKAVFKPLDTIHVRVDVNGSTGQAISMNPGTSRSHYVKAVGAGTVRIWIQEERGAIVPIADARANVHVPFAIDWIRVAAMAALALLVAIWRPGSRLWRITFDPSSTRQRLAFAAIAAIPTLAIGASIIWQLTHAMPLAFHTAGGYTYDFDQYGHVADSLIAGRPWLDLDVPGQLAQSTHPYDVPTRLKLLEDGVSPMYWDYAYYEGHWYSYFGVLPAVLLFVPYRLITGHMLPTAAAEQFLVLLFIIFFSLLVLRVIHRVMSKTSLAAASLITVSALLGRKWDICLPHQLLPSALRRFSGVDFTGIMVLAGCGYIQSPTNTVRPLASRRRTAAVFAATGRRRPMHRGELRLPADLCAHGPAGHRPVLAADPRYDQRSCASTHYHAQSVARAACHGDTCIGCGHSADVVEQSALRQSDRLRQRLPIHRLRHDPLCHPDCRHAGHRLVLPVPTGAICTKLPVAGGLPRANAGLGLLRGDGRRTVHRHAADAACISAAVPA